MGKKNMEKAVELDGKVGLDGEKYYKCRHCSAVGNWKMFIKERMSCLQANKTKNGDKIIR